MSSPSLLQRLKERKLVQWALAYLAGAWVILEVTDVVGGRWNLPDTLFRGFSILLLAGFFITLVLAWYHGEKGRQRVSGPELLMVTALLVVAGIAITVLGKGPDGAGTSEAETQAVSATLDGRPGVAALPWRNLSGRQEDLYFTNGIHDEILTRLQKIGGLRVIARQSVMQFRDSDKTMGQIASELGVQYVLDAGLLRAQDTVRITAALIDAASEESLWTDTYDRPLSTETLLSVQSDVAERIAEALEVQISPREKEVVEGLPTESFPAYDLYLLGRYHWSQLSPEGLALAVGYFEDALAIDPGFAQAYTGLADVYMIQTQGWGQAPETIFPNARRAATRALELDPTLAEAHASDGHVRLFYDWDWRGAEASLTRAIELNPNYAEASHWLALCLAAQGRHEESLAAIRKALALDPRSPYIKLNLGYLLYLSRDYHRAIEVFKEGVEAHPESPLIRAFRGAALLQADRIDEGIRDLETASEMLGGRNLIPEAYLGFGYAKAGRIDEAEQVLRRLQEASSDRFVNPEYLAIIYVGLGRTDEAVEWLNRATDARTDWPVFFPVDPVTDAIRSDPRYQALLDRVGLGHLRSP